MFPSRCPHSFQVFPSILFPSFLLLLCFLPQFLVSPPSFHFQQCTSLLSTSMCLCPLSPINVPPSFPHNKGASIPTFSQQFASSFPHFEQCASIYSSPIPRIKPLPLLPFPVMFLHSAPLIFGNVLLLQLPGFSPRQPAAREHYRLILYY